MGQQSEGGPRPLPWEEFYSCKRFRNLQILKQVILPSNDGL
jgi:hypothetical protein